MKLLFSGFLIFVLFGCKPSINTDDLAHIRAEVLALADDEKKSTFLANLRAADQGERSETTKISIEDRYKNDLYRIEQVGTYLEEYGYPSREKLGDDAADAPILILHHSPFDELRYKYFDQLYRGYLNGDIDADGLAFFLGRFQKGVNGEWITFDRPFTVEEELDTLIVALGLEKKVLDLQNQKTTQQ